MAKEKEAIGFRTPSKEIEDVFSKVQKELSKRRTDWNTLRKMWSGTNKNLKELKNIQGTSIEIISLEIAVANGMQMAGLGVELLETHTRLAQIEKAINELKLRK